MDLSKLDFEITGTNADITPPVIDTSSFNVSPKEATKENSPTFTVKVSDDREVRSCYIEIEHKNENGSVTRTHIPLELTGGEKKDGTWTGTLNIDDATPSGQWTAIEVGAYDANRNIDRILPLGWVDDFSSDYRNADLSALDFTITGTHADLTGPTIDISELSVSPKKATPDDPATFTVKATDESGISTCHIAFRHVATGSLAIVFLNSTDGVTWTGTFDVKSATKPGEWVCAYIRADDTHDNSTILWSPETYPDRDNTHDLSAADFTVTKPDEDSTAPEVQYATATISTDKTTSDQPPTFTVQVTDNVGVESCEVTYHNADEDMDLTVPLRLKSGTATSGTWTAVLEDCTAPGTWQIKYISALDANYNIDRVWDTRATQTAAGRTANLSDYDFTVTSNAQDEVTVTYSDGLNGTVFPDKQMDVAIGDATPAFGKDPTRDGYRFVGWNPKVSPTVTESVTYTAVWEAETPKTTDISTLDPKLIKPVDGKYVYDPDGVKPAVQVRDGNKDLTEGVDYDVTYVANKQAGTATAVITGKGDYSGTTKLEFTISPANLDDVATIDPVDDQTLVKDSVTPKVTVRHGDKVLEEGIDYDIISYEDNDEPGTATINIRGKGNYQGDTSTEFVVTEAPGLDDANLDITSDTFVYDGVTKAPEVTVTIDGKPLTRGVDYEYEGESPDVGEHQLTIRGKGTYEGQSRTVSFKVTPADISQATIIVGEAYLLKGGAVEPKPVIEFNDTTLVENEDYELSWSDNTAPGTGSVTIVGKGNFEGTVIKQFEILSEAQDISSAKVTLTLDLSDPYVYDGTEKRPGVSVMLNDNELTPGVDYDVEYSGNKNAGTATVTVKGKEAFANTATLTFEIARRNAIVRANPASKTEGDEDPALTAEVEGTIDTDTLEYTITRDKGEEPGSYPINVTGNNPQGNYDVRFVGSTFIIKAGTAHFDVTPLSALTYTGSSLTPTVSVKSSHGTPLVEGQDYTVSYGENIHAGDKAGTVTVTGKGRYSSQTEHLTFDILPKNATIRANDASKTEGESDPAFTWTVAGLAGTDTISKATVTRQAGQEPGTYTIQVKDAKVSASDGTDVTSDYKLTYETGKFTIHAANARFVVTPLDSLSNLTYTGSALTPSVDVRDTNGTPLVEDEDYTITYGENIHAGNRAGSITVTGKGKYADQTERLTFDILPKNATIQVADVSKTEGESDPALTWTVSGLVGTDTVSKATVTRQEGEKPGTYTIQMKDAKVSASDGTDVTSDYRLTYKTGTLTIKESGSKDPTKPTDPSDPQKPAQSSTAPSYMPWPAMRIPSYSYRRPSYFPTYSVRESTDRDTHKSETTASKVSNKSAQGKVIRHAGPTRYDTMDSVVTAAFGHSDWVVIASGESYPDALSAIALAGAHDAPVVLTASNQLSKQAETQVRRLGASHAIIVGGKAAVSDKVEAALKGIVSDVTRVAGKDRTDTSVSAMSAVRSTKPTSDTLIVASGNTFADALSIGPWAWKTSSPIVLTNSRGMLTQEAIAAIKSAGNFKRVLIVGGQSAVSDAIKDQLGTGFRYDRKGGSDRYDTSLQIAQFATDNGLNWLNPTVATGADFADALSGAALAGKLGSPLLLVGGNDGKAVGEIAKRAPAVQHVHILGGTAAVPSSVESSLNNSLS